MSRRHVFRGVCPGWTGAITGTCRMDAGKEDVRQGLLLAHPRACLIERDEVRVFFRLGFYVRVGLARCVRSDTFSHRSPSPPTTRIAVAPCVNRPVPLAMMTLLWAPPQGGFHGVCVMNEPRDMCLVLSPLRVEPDGNVLPFQAQRGS